MAAVSGLGQALMESPTILEFDRMGRAAINIGSIAFLELSRVWGIQLQPRGHSDAHFVDYRITNDLGTSEGQLFFYWQAQRRIANSEIPFDIAPGLNRLELIVYSMDHPEAKQPFFFQFNIGGRIYQAGDVKFILADYTGNYSDEFLDRMAQNISMLQSCVPGFHNTLTFKLQNSRYGISAIRNYLRNPFVEIACLEGQPENETESTIVHEKAHGFYDNISEPEKVKGIVDFEDFYYKSMREGGFGKKKFGIRIAGDDPTSYDKDSVFGVFMERHYAGQSSNAGHPWDGPMELFASATGILVNHQEQLFERIKCLRTEEERNLANQVVLKVLGLYGIYCKTGTKIFEQEKVAP